MIKDTDKRAIIEEVLVEFQQLESELSSKRFTIIHGDLNEANILVSGITNPKVTGIIDFQDVHGAPTIFDLAILSAYVLLECNVGPELEGPKHLIRGYESILPLSQEDRNMVPTLVASRLCQSLVLGAYSYSQRQDEYVMKTAKKGWVILNLIRNKWTKEELIKLWFS